MAPGHSPGQQGRRCVRLSGAVGSAPRPCPWKQSSALSDKVPCFTRTGDSTALYSPLEKQSVTNGLGVCRLHPAIRHRGLRRPETHGDPAEACGIME